MMCSTLYKGDGLQLIICECYVWKMALYVSLSVLFSNMQVWKVIQEKVGDAGIVKAYITNDEMSH
jgi:hypothetical protein